MTTGIRAQRRPDSPRQRPGSPRFAQGLAYLPPTMLIAGLVVVWEVGTTVLAIKPVILPAPTLVVRTLIEDRELFFSNLGVTLLEVLLGFAAGFAVGFIAAVAVVYSRTLERAIYPLIVATQMVPVFAIAPLLIVWLGFGIEPKVVIVALGVLFPIAVNLVAGLRSADEGVLNLMRALNAPPLRIFLSVRLPSSVPFLKSASQVAVTYATIGAVIAEFIGSEAGIGKVMIQANATGRTDRVFGGILLVSALALGLFALVRIIGWWLTPWERVRSPR
jgi:NitT/TauT family transport system permease protein